MVWAKAVNSECEFRCHEIDGLVQDCSNSSALAMELLQSYTKPLKLSSQKLHKCIGWSLRNHLLLLDSARKFKIEFILRKTEIPFDECISYKPLVWYDNKVILIWNNSYLNILQAVH